MTRKTKSPDWFGPNWYSISMDAWALAAESNMVIAQRMGAMAFGGPAAAKEAELMVSEKVAANMALGLEIATGKHGMSPESVIRGSINHYSRKVAANRKRLSR